MHDVQYRILHNRKTGGTAIKDLIDKQKERLPSFNVHCFGHAMTFPRLVTEHPESLAIFFIREPISRFISGFYSRLREGKPRYHFAWSSGEARAFAVFSTPNQLAEALSSSNAQEKKAAYFAMQTIGHVRHTYLEFLGPPSYLTKQAERIAFIGHQADFDADLAALRSLLNIDADIVMPNDDLSAHRNPADLDKQLSEHAIENLKNWYEPDLEIYEWCLAQREQIKNRLMKSDNLFC